MVRGGAYEELGAQASKIVDTAARAGANDIGGIAFFVNDARDAQTKALQAAVRDAERNASTGEGNGCGARLVREKPGRLS